jgi:hypothetical protein
VRIIEIERVFQNRDCSAIGIYKRVVLNWWRAEDAQNEADDDDEKNGGTNSLVVCWGVRVGRVIVLKKEGPAFSSGSLPLFMFSPPCLRFLRCKSNGPRRSL